MSEQKYRDVVFIQQLFPKILDDFQSFEDFDPEKGSIRFYLMQKLILQNDVTTAKILVTEEAGDKIYLIQRQFAQVRNAKKAALLIKEFSLDLKVIDKEFAEIESCIINESMNFYMQQFGVSWKHYNMENVLRLADFLVDHGS